MAAMLLALMGLPSLAAQPLSGVLRLAGNPEMSGVVARWSAGFGKIHPEVRIETHLTGSDTGMAALYSSKADIALLGRTPTASEIQAFEWVFRYKPAQVEIMTGSLDRPGQSPAPVLFVHRDNPLANLTLAQLDAIFGTAHRLAPADLRTWGQLGLTGEWADQPIHLYAPDAMSGTGRFFRHVVLDDSRMMNWAQLTEFSDTGGPRTATHDAGRQILAALAADRHGLAVASLGFTPEGVRPVALEGITASRENLIARRYPLTRTVTACFNRKPEASTDPLVAEFLRYILSAEGQREISRASAYLPLAPEFAVEAPKYGLAAGNHIHAQQLVAEIMAANPGLVAAGLHCVPPGGDKQAIIASTLDVIGKPSDPEDILHGSTTIVPSRKAPKLGVMLPLLDRTGREIGSLALQFTFRAGEDQVKYLAEATAIRDHAARQIPSLAELFKPTP